MTTFDDALAFELAVEGGRVDNKRDPGGRTAYGITQRTFDAWQDAHGLPRRDVWTITPAEVAAIYRNGYFDPVHFERLPAGVGLCVVDDAVNSGVRESGVELQRALGMTGAALDGIIGELTIAAAAKVDPAVLIGRLCDGRLGFMRRCKGKDGALLWRVFGLGWGRRVEAVRARALAMAKAPSTGSGPSIVAPKNNTAPAAPCARPGCPLARAA